MAENSKIEEWIGDHAWRLFWWALLLLALWPARLLITAMDRVDELEHWHLNHGVAPCMAGDAGPCGYRIRSLISLGDSESAQMLIDLYAVRRPPALGQEGIARTVKNVQKRRAVKGR